MIRILFAVVLLLIFMGNNWAQPSLRTYKITSEPSGAQIYIDDKIMGSTPYSLSVSDSTEHILVLKRDRFEDWQTVLNSGLIEMDEIHATLNPLRGKIQVNCDVPGAAILLDGKYVGPAPKLLTDLEYGTHVLEVKRNIYKTREKKVIFKQDVEITGSGIKLVSVILGTSWITADSRPVKGAVFLEGDSLGWLPFEKKKITPGAYELAIKKENFETVYSELDIQPGQHNKLGTFELVPMTYTKVFYRSLLFPGYGQLYAERTFRGYLYTILEIGSIGGAIFMELQRADAEQMYKDKYALYQTANSENLVARLRKAVQDNYDKAIDSENLRNIFVGGAVAVWLLNIVDAHFLGKSIEKKNGKFYSVLKNSKLFVHTNSHSSAIGINIPF